MFRQIVMSGAAALLVAVVPLVTAVDAIAVGAPISEASPVAPTGTPAPLPDLALTTPPAHLTPVPHPDRIAAASAMALVDSMRCNCRKNSQRYSHWYARRYMKAKYHWGKRQYRALVRIFDHESGWQHRNMNSQSGAYGIPQALPGYKMSIAGRDWATNPATQIRWGLWYIKGRYGSPIKAWSFWQSNLWY